MQLLYVKEQNNPTTNTTTVKTQAHIIISLQDDNCNETR